MCSEIQLLDMKKKSGWFHSIWIVLFLMLYSMPLTGFAQESELDAGMNKVKDLFSGFGNFGQDEQQENSQADSSGQGQNQDQSGLSEDSEELEETVQFGDGEFPMDSTFLWGLDQVPSTPPIPNFMRCGLGTIAELTTALAIGKPSVESALDRVNTAARFLHLGELVIHLPISAGSEWPQKANNIGVEEVQNFSKIIIKERKLQQQNFSFTKLRGLYLQQLLFDQYPDLNTIPKYDLHDPSIQEVKALGTKILGSNYNPEFNSVFHWILRHYPNFEPKREIFLAGFNEKPTEIFPNMVQAVHSLAANQDSLQQVEEEISISQNNKWEMRRNMEDALIQIREVRSEQLKGADSKQKHTKEQQEELSEEMEFLKEEFELQVVDYENAVKEYLLALEKLKVEMERIKDDQTALSKEQQALAQNIQHTVEIAQNVICGSEVQVGLASYYLYKGIPQFPDEIKTLISTRENGRERVRRIYINVVSLPWNLNTIISELGLLSARVTHFDDLFEDRLEQKCQWYQDCTPPGEEEQPVENGEETATEAAGAEGTEEENDDDS